MDWWKNIKGVLKALGIGFLIAFAIWMFSGSDSSFGIGVAIAYVEWRITALKKQLTRLVFGEGEKEVGQE